MINDSSLNKLRKPENIRHFHSYTRKNENKLSYNHSHVGVDSSLTSNEDFQKLAQKVVKVRDDLIKFEKSIDAQFIEMKAVLDASLKSITEEIKSLKKKLQQMKI
ncbi:hypothetical protein H5410_036637 [Solanum commersonii]|uniref:Uncharacterized protein n=1 Tax=Solanum commersonii TaxID=4109 RepID=A0A9J5Y5F0_SOLCO|nr:hypothetical protein H5410_036637 [Solanum commersonii]